VATTTGARASAAASSPGERSGEQTWVVPLSDVLVDDEIEQAVLAVVRSGWWSMGPQVAEFEREFASFCGAAHAFSVTNGTAALHLALLALGCGPGDEVLVPSLNFVAAANTIGHVGASPVFCDITSTADLTVSPEDLEAAIGPATRAIVVMHYGGHPCQMDEILELAARRGLAVIEDAAHAPGATYRGRLCGTIGDVGCFSFFSNHGMTTLTWDRHRGHAHSYDVVAQGFNYRLDEIRAAIGRVQLSRVERQNAERARVVAFYRAALDGTNGLKMPLPPKPDTAPAHHLAVVLTPPARSRDDVRAFLAERRIQTSVHYPPIHRFSAYRELGARRPLPTTEDVAERLVTLPLYPHMTDDDALAVVTALLAAT
jgi:dTDP-4-amino-4,6-dideoxygalactose transaminase